MTLDFKTLARAGSFAGLALPVLTLPALATGGVYQDQGGIVAIEIEDLDPVGGWGEYNNFSGFTGDGFFRWDGPDLFNSPGSGIIGYEFDVETVGAWQLSIHNRHNDPSPDQENDVWVRMDGGGWEKVYSNLGTSTVNVWNWHTRFDFGSDPHTDAIYQLSLGTHLIEFSGRSNGWMMNRFHIYRPGNPDGTNENLTPSVCGNGPQNYCTGKLSSSGCSAQIASATPSQQPISGATDYTVILETAEANRSGIFFTSAAGAAVIPFQGGTLCMNPPLKRSDPLFTGGTGGACDGTYSLIINDGNMLSIGFGFDAGPGGTSYVQAWHRDPLIGDGTGSVLSDAMQLDWQ